MLFPVVYRLFYCSIRSLFPPSLFLSSSVSFALLSCHSLCTLPFYGAILFFYLNWFPSFFGIGCFDLVFCFPPSYFDFFPFFLKNYPFQFPSPPVSCPGLHRRFLSGDLLSFWCFKAGGLYRVTARRYRITARLCRWTCDLILLYFHSTGSAAECCCKLDLRDCFWISDLLSGPRHTYL